MLCELQFNPYPADHNYYCFNLYHLFIKSLIFGTKCVFKSGFASDRFRIEQILIFTHLKLWFAVARHNLKWMKI